MQILRDGEGHWATVSTQTSSRSVGLLHTEYPVTSRSSDCGLYALAFATANAVLFEERKISVSPEKREVQK